MVAGYQLPVTGLCDDRTRILRIEWIKRILLHLRSIIPIFKFSNHLIFKPACRQAGYSRVPFTQS
jgi:hypothetical protein